MIASNDASAENWAAIASLIVACKLNRTDPHRYLAERLARLVGGWRQARIDDFMLRGWATPQQR